MFPKAGSLRCEAWLEWVRQRPCFHCGAPGPSDPHHFPSKGSSGVTRDDYTVPLCRECHDEAQRYRISKDRQWQGVYFTRSRFFEEATAEQLDGYLRARRQWLESRGMVSP